MHREDVAQAITFVGPNHLVVGGYSAASGTRQFALAAFETTRTGSTSCVGDCNAGGSVTVDELLTMVNIALGNVDVTACAAGDANRDGRVTINEIVTAVNVALTGCPTT